MLSYQLKLKERNVNIDVPKLLDRAGRYMVSSSVGKIMMGGSTKPGEWTENKPLTVAIKRGSNPLRDTGQLMSSIHHTMRGTDSVVISTNRAGARLQNEGGTIRPKKGKYLWIPANYKVRQDLMRSGWSITNLIRKLKTTGQCRKSGHAFLYRKDKKDDWEVVFVLKESVHIPQRRFFGFEEKDKVEIMKIFRKAMDGSV